VLPYEEFLALQEWLEDLVELRAAKESEHGAPTVPLAELERRFEEAD
jgi:hypothetical protein